MRRGVFPRTLPKALAGLGELALDLRWTWSHAGDALRTALAVHWAEVRVAAVGVGRAGGHWRFAVQVSLGAVAPDGVRVELYAEPLEGDTPVRVVMDRVEGTAGAQGGDVGFVYRASVPASRPASDYTPRIVPHHPDARIPMEAAHIRWPR
jgi:starch phosphorylase